MTVVTDALATNSKGTSIDVINLSYSVKSGEKIKKLLREVSFSIEPGCMAALMGPSGAGKSTLLDMLANRKLVGWWSGEIFINKAERSKYFNRDSAYVLQDDVHIATLTVEETIFNAAWTRLPEGTSKADMQQRVDMLLELMGMNHIRESLVGDGMHKGISGGQLKRLSIAVEIVALPDLIFLDEPTSGLDSAIALEVMSTVRKMANQNRTCISTIHQPSPEVFSLFDKVCLVSAGRMIFFGNVDEVVTYFTGADLGYKYNGSQNPAEFMIDVSNGQIYPNELRMARYPEELENIYSRSKLWKAPPQIGLFGSAESADVQSKHETEHATSIKTQSQMLLYRTWISAIRDTRDQGAQLGKNFVVGTLIGIVFWDQANVETPLYSDDTFHEPSSSVQNVTSLLFFGMCFCLMSNLQAIPYLCLRNHIYRRELASYAYSPFPYWLAQTVTNLPILALNHFIFIIIIYFCCGFPSSAEYFFYFFFALYLANIISYYCAMYLAVSTGSQQMAFSLFPLTFLFFSTFSGYAIAVHNVPTFWTWAPFISYARWTFEGLMVNQWGQYNDDDNGNVLAQYDFNDFNKNNTIWISLLFMGFFGGMCYISMQPPKRHLEKVNDVSDLTNEPATILQKSVTAFRQTTLDIASLGGGVGDKSIKENLLKGGGQIDDQDADEFKPQTTYDVQWYRESTGMVQQAKGQKVCFVNLHYAVPSKDGKSMLPLLKGVSGRVAPGEMCALMGASGAGKSTLLDVIAGRKNTGEIKGEILFNGQGPNNSIMKNTAYVMQDNVHYGVLTVKESLQYAAAFRLQESLSPKEKEDAIDKILDMLGLKEVGDTVVGDENTRGISGGQCKRLSIGVEIVALPDVIFLDEPTTGLDSAISYEVMAAVRNLANQNRTVICTIHQPSPQTYMLFDKLLLLAEGRVIFYGANRDVVNYFTTCPYQFYYKPGSNPADYVIAVAGSFVFASSGQKIPGGELAALYASSDLHQALMTSLEKPENNEVYSESAVALSMDEYNTSTMNQLKTLMHRVCVRTYRNRKTSIIVPFLRHVIIGLFYGTIYFNLPTGTTTVAYNDRLALFFFSLMFVIIGHQQSIPLLQEDRLIFYRERGAKAYGAFPYWISCWFLLIPLTIVNVFIFSLLEYNLTNMQPSVTEFFVFYYVLLFSSLTGMFTCQMISALAPSTQAALSLFPIILFFSCAFSGFIVYIPDFPSWLGSWAPYFSFMRYGFETLVLSQFSDNSQLPNGPNYISTLGFTDETLNECAGILLLFMGFFACCLLAALKYVDFEER